MNRRILEIATFVAVLVIVTGCCCPPRGAPAVVKPCEAPGAGTMAPATDVAPAPAPAPTVVEEVPPKDGGS